MTESKNTPEKLELTLMSMGMGARAARPRTQPDEPLGVFARTAQPDGAHPHPNAWLPAPRVLEWLEQPPSSALSLPCHLPPTTTTAHAARALVPRAHGERRAERGGGGREEEAEEEEARRLSTTTTLFGVRPMQLLSTLQRPPSSASVQQSYDGGDVVGVEDAAGSLFGALPPPQVRIYIYCPALVTC